jgi:hypothetical protein
MRTLLLALAPFMLMGAQAAPESGRDVAQKSLSAQFALKTLKVSGEMTLTRGRETIGSRSIVLELIEQAADDQYDKARITIGAPTALIQRIADRGRQAAFVSSDFSYEDILKWQVDDYDYTRAGQGPCPAGTCTIVDAKPRNRFSSYTRVRLYYDDRLRISRIDYFAGGADSPRKTLVHSDYVQQGSTWQPSRSVMTNHETETATQIVWSGYGVDVPIDERVMTAATAGR